MSRFHIHWLLAAWVMVASPRAEAEGRSLKAFYREGQTFLTWREDAAANGEWYRIYASDVPITAANLKRADLIARTETTAAANFGRLSELEAEGFQSSEWFANPGARESHAELSGREVPLGEEFGYGLRYPGDSQAGAAQVANCRCVLIPGTHKDYPDL